MYSWMFSRVRMESTCPNLFHDPFAGREYESALHLWTTYAKGIGWDCLDELRIVPEYGLWQLMV